MSEPAPGAAIQAEYAESFASTPGVLVWGHPRRGIRAIPRYPLSTATVEADRVLASKRPISDTSGLGYPVAQGGIAPIGS